MKGPLIDTDKRRILSTLLKNDHLTVRSIHNHMLEKIVYTKYRHRDLASSVIDYNLSNDDNKSKLI